MRRIATVIVCVATAGLLALGNDTDFSALKPAERLQKLDWMRGEWIRDQAGDSLEEIWSAPSGDSLKSQGPREVIFENPKRNDPRRFVYRLDEQGRLVVRLESEREGKVGTTEFLFTKRP